jgi:hypothetical protein
MLLMLDYIGLAMPAGEEDAARAFFMGVLGMTEDEKPEPPRSSPFRLWAVHGRNSSPCTLTHRGDG